MPDTDDEALIERAYQRARDMEVGNTSPYLRPEELRRMVIAAVEPTLTALAAVRAQAVNACDYLNIEDQGEPMVALVATIEAVRAQRDEALAQRDQARGVALNTARANAGDADRIAAVRALHEGSHVCWDPDHYGARPWVRDLLRRRGRVPHDQRPWVFLGYRGGAVSDQLLGRLHKVAERHPGCAVAVTDAISEIQRLRQHIETVEAESTARLHRELNAVKTALAGALAADLPSPHQAVVTDGGEQGIWLVYCEGCSKEAQDYIYPCALPDALGSRYWPPHELVQRQRPYRRHR